MAEISVIESSERFHDVAIGTRPSRLEFIDAATLIRTIAPRVAIDLVDAAMQHLSDNGMDAPERWAVPFASGGSMALMPGADPTRGCFGVKVLSLFDKEARGDLPGHQGLMLLFDYATGRPLAAIDANALTGLRTAAASAVATRALARSDAHVLALIGTGEQARWHASMIPLVRPIDEIRIWGRSIDAARQFARLNCRSTAKVTICNTVEEALQSADIVCTLTHSPDPVVKGEWLRAGQHVNLVGSSTAASREVDDRAVARSYFVVDSRTNALSQAGELMGAIRAGVVTADHIRAEIGDILSGRAPGRPSREAITAYKSLGHVAQDLAVGIAAVRGLDRSDTPSAVAWEQR